MHDKVFFRLSRFSHCTLFVNESLKDGFVSHFWSLCNLYKYIIFLKVKFQWFIGYQMSQTCHKSILWCLCRQICLRVWSAVFLCFICELSNYPDNSFNSMLFVTVWISGRSNRDTKCCMQPTMASVRWETSDGRFCWPTRSQKSSRPTTYSGHRPTNYHTSTTTIPSGETTTAPSAALPPAPTTVGQRTAASKKPCTGSWESWASNCDVGWSL